jgi:hypothetical protein
VLPEYNPYGLAPDTTGQPISQFHHRPVTIRDRRDGVFDSMYVRTNRARYGRDGTFYPEQGVNRGRLRFGSDSASTLSDWYYDRNAGLLEIRIPWGLLNVSDPSTRTLLYETIAKGSFGAVRSEGFRIGVLTYRDGEQRTLEGALPAIVSGRRWLAQSFRNWQWDGWETPRYHERLKPVWDSMRQTWGRIR